MAATTQVLSDTNKKAVIKFTNTFSGTDETEELKIQANALFGALDTNNSLLNANTTAKTYYDLSVARITYSVNIPNGYLQIDWKGGDTANNGTICVVSGNGELNPRNNLPVIGNNAANNPNGDIVFTTVGVTANDSYTVIMELHKNNTHYDIGVFQDPSAFNYPPYSSYNP